MPKKATEKREPKKPAMKPATKPAMKPVTARGNAIDRTDEELDEMCSAEAMMALADEAAEDWRENAPRDFKNLLDAEPR
jgi:hypothetical protein